MYRLVTSPKFDKEFIKLDHSVQIKIKKWLDKHLINVENPRAFGKGLTGNLSGKWRYLKEASNENM